VCEPCAAGRGAIAKVGISAELIDVQTLLPFDLGHSIVASLKKTNRILVIDEDVPGGASAYILQQVLEVQKGYRHLDSDPQHTYRQGPQTGLRHRRGLFQQAERGGYGGSGLWDDERGGSEEVSGVVLRFHNSKMLEEKTLI
jgi:hypothetical protein